MDTEVYGKVKLNIMASSEIGQKGENLAAEFLENCGYKILERNFKTPFGEIDIISKKEKILAIVEVKSALVKRFSNPEFAPELHVNKRKRQKLIKLGEFYLASHKKLVDIPWEIDIVAVEINPYGLYEIRHWRQAVTAD